MNNTRIVFMGTPKFASNVLEGLLSNGYNIVGVVSQPDKEIGRKKILTASPVKEVAIRNNLQVFTPKRIRNEYQEILDLDPELIITCAYGQIIPKEILDYPKYKCINTHGSLLPKGRGGAPIQHALIDGETKTGITLMYMNEKMDEGDILYQEEIAIADDDTNTSLFSKLSDLALNMLIKFIPDYLNGNFKVTKQDDSKATYTYNLTKEDEFISFNKNTKVVYNHIRGLLDNPGAYFVLDHTKYKITKVGYKLCDIENPNTIVGLDNDYFRINCIDGFIKIYKIKAEGKNEMDAKAFFNGKGKNLIGLNPNIDYE